MDVISCSIDGELVTTRVAARMEDTMQAFAVRAACFIGELEVPFTEEFDGHDYGATHVVAYLGTEPVGTLRLRWFKSFAMPERLAVIQRFRGHNIGQLLLERACKLAENRGCNILYSRASPEVAKYLERQGWRSLPAEGSTSAGRQTVAMVRSVDIAQPRPARSAIDALTLSEEFRMEVPLAALGDAGVVGPSHVYR
jgi:GNAT superfamily N-acetyltransferase